MPSERVHYPGQVHGFFHVLALMPEAEDAGDRAAKALAHPFATISIDRRSVAAGHGEIGVDGTG